MICHIMEQSIQLQTRLCAKLMILKTCLQASKQIYQCCVVSEKSWELGVKSMTATDLITLRFMSDGFLPTHSTTLQTTRSTKTARDIDSDIMMKAKDANKAPKSSTVLLNGYGTCYSTVLYQNILHLPRSNSLAIQAIMICRTQLPPKPNMTCSAPLTVEPESCEEYWNSPGPFMKMTRRSLNTTLIIKGRKGIPTISSQFLRGKTMIDRHSDSLLILKLAIR